MTRSQDLVLVLTNSLTDVIINRLY